MAAAEVSLTRSVQLSTARKRPKPLPRTAVSGAIVQSLWPIPETTLGAAFDGVDRIVVPELNLGLYRREIDRIAGDREVVGIEKVNGDLITAEEILEVIG